MKPTLDLVNDSNGYNVDSVAKRIDFTPKSQTKERSHTKKDE